MTEQKMKLGEQCPSGDGGTVKDSGGSVGLYCDMGWDCDYGREKPKPPEQKEILPSWAVEVREHRDWLYKVQKGENKDSATINRLLQAYTQVLVKLEKSKESIEELAEALELIRSSASAPTESSQPKGDNCNLPGFHELRRARKTLKELEE